MLTSEHIKLIRKAYGMNTTQFANLLGVTVNAVARWEMGDRHPRYTMMVRLNEMAKEKGVELNGIPSGKRSKQTA